jgi:hypothetical protein
MGVKMKAAVTTLLTSSILLFSCMVHGIDTVTALIMLFLSFLCGIYTLSMFTHNRIAASLLTLVIILILSFFPPYHAAVLSTLFLISSILILVIKKEIFKTFIQQDFLVLKTLSYADIIMWEILFFAGASFGFWACNYFFTHDYIHPLYEASIGQSYHNYSILNTPDLSFYGKLLKCHFLSTNLPIYFSEIFNLPLFETIYFITPLFSLLMVFLVITAFFRKYPTLKIPLVVLFLFLFGARSAKIG